MLTFVSAKWSLYIQLPNIFICYLYLSNIQYILSLLGRWCRRLISRIISHKQGINFIAWIFMNYWRLLDVTCQWILVDCRKLAIKWRFIDWLMNICVLKCFQLHLTESFWDQYNEKSGRSMYLKMRKYNQLSRNWTILP